MNRNMALGDHAGPSNDLSTVAVLLAAESSISSAHKGPWSEGLLHFTADHDSVCSRKICQKLPRKITPEVGSGSLGSRATRHSLAPPETPVDR
jgi:hypothetical protein